INSLVVIADPVSTSTRAAASSALSFFSFSGAGALAFTVVFLERVPLALVGVFVVLVFVMVRSSRWGFGCLVRREPPVATPLGRSAFHGCDTLPVWPEPHPVDSLVFPGFRAAPPFARKRLDHNPAASSDTSRAFGVVPW